MLNVILVTESAVAAESVKERCRETNFLHLLDWIPRYPSAHEFLRFLNTLDADLLLIDASDQESALRLMEGLREAVPGLPIIAFGAGWESGFREAIAAAADEVLVSPVTAPELRHGAETALRCRSQNVANLYAFLPAKAGNGCTSVVLNTAGVLVQRLGQKALVIECDLHSGVLSILLNVQPENFMQDALCGAVRLDTLGWKRLVTARFGVDWLLANRERKGPLSAWYDYFKLLQFAHRRYDWILADLPEVVNDATVEIVRAAKGVFVVCTPEILSLRLVAQRCSELKNRGVPVDKLKIVLNRWREEELSEDEVEEYLQLPVAAVIPNDYAAVKQSIVDSHLVDPTSVLGEVLEDFARQLSGLPAPERTGKASVFSRMKKRWL